MPVSAVDCVGPAIQHTRDQLFRNFRFSQWARLALVGILAAEVHSGGCSFRNFNIPMNRPRPRGDEFLPTNFPHIDPAHLGQYLGLIAIAALLAVALIFVFLYISSVFRFILFASVLQKNCSIGEGWRRWQRTGGRFFLWQLVFQIVAGMFFLLLIGLPFAWAFGSGWAEHAKEHLGVLILGGIFLAGLVLFSLLVAVVIQVLAKDFLVPIMALEDLDFADGWNRLLPIVSNDFGKFVVYLLLKLVLSIAAAILFGVLAVIPVVVLLLPAVALGVAGYFSGLGWNPGTIALAVICGGAFLALLVYAVSLISVPATVFFPAYSIYFFAARYPNLAAILYPAPPVPAAAPAPPIPETPPPEPTSLPPSPEPIG